MVSGGARANSGPAPDLNALRRERKSDGEWLTLPSEGRKGSAPVWPFEVGTDRELSLWETLWRRPIAVVWERDHQFEYVALYVRAFVEAETPGATPATRTLVKQLAGELLLTIPAMHSARVKIAQDQVSERRNVEKKPDSGKSLMRDRLKALDGGGG